MKASHRPGGLATVSPMFSLCCSARRVAGAAGPAADGELPGLLPRLISCPSGGVGALDEQPPLLGAVVARSEEAPPHFFFLLGRAHWHCVADACSYGGCMHAQGTRATVHGCSCFFFRSTELLNLVDLRVPAARCAPLCVY